MFQGLVRAADEVVTEVRLQLGPLLAELGEVDEEPRAHVSLEGLDAVRSRRAVTLREQSAILEQTAAADFFRSSRRDQFLRQMLQRLVEISVHGFPDD